MGYDLLPANPARNAHDFRTDTMGILAASQVGRRMGEMADKVSDGTFLWCDALLRNITIFYNWLYIRYYIKSFKTYATKLQQKYHKMLRAYLRYMFRQSESNSESMIC